MTAPIEIVVFDNPNEVTSLAEAVYGNAEPGFQIDGIKTYDQLTDVFNALRRAVPKEAQQALKFNNGYLYTPNGNTSEVSLDAHIDTSFKGFAVHHNISDKVPVTIATATKWSENLIGGVDDCSFDDASIARNVRQGLTVPGRLTVFSEGNIAGTDRPFTGLLPTIHHFDRTQTTGPNLWARYTTASRLAQLVFARQTIFVKRVAEKSLTLSANHTR